jgi:tetratricopeptide (TPR) repeat protein
MSNVKQFSQDITGNVIRLSSLRLIVVVFAMLLIGGCGTMSGQSRTAPGAVLPEVREAFEAAMVAIHNEDFTKAEEILGPVIGKSQQNPIPHINLALVQIRQNKLDEAEATLEKALTIEPMNPVANNELGLLYRKTGRFEEARKVYETVLGRHPNYPAANKNLGILCDLYLRDYACAYKAYQAYGDIVPEDQGVRIWLIDMERRLAR